MTFLIRKMTSDDIQKVQQVAKISWNHTYEGIIPPNIQSDFLQSAYNDESMKRRLEYSYIYVSEVDGNVVGFANFSPIKEGGVIELGSIYLLPDYQGKGIGTKLLQTGINDFTGIKEVFINVEKENKVGATFYKAKGFKVVSEFNEDFAGHSLKTVRMVLYV